jgi:hypothetical protein
MSMEEIKKSSDVNVAKLIVSCDKHFPINGDVSPTK